LYDLKHVEGPAPAAGSSKPWSLNCKSIARSVEIKGFLTSSDPNWYEKRSFVKNEFSMRKPGPAQYERLIAFVNRKAWWHVPPRDPNAYRKRGKFLASSFREAEFWGRPLMNPLKVSVKRILVGDERTIERRLFGRRVSNENITMEERWKLDARMKSEALRLGYDSILLMSPQAFAGLRSNAKIPRSLELNILNGDFRQVPRECGTVGSMHVFRGDA
jgi:hypothetical protein